MDVPTLQAKLSRGEPLHVLDIRRAADRRDWSIPGSDWVECYDDLWRGDTSRLDAAALPHDKTIVTVCARGATAKKATDHLRQKGYRVETLEGGMAAWNLAWNTAETRLSDGTRLVQLRRTGKGCLSYLAESAGEAVVVDANVAPEVYEGLAERLGARIVGGLDTHTHADHLSRTPLLARRLGVPYHAARTSKFTFDFHALDDGDAVDFGDSRIAAMATPGHTWDSHTYRLGDVVLTGDTLFTDGVGRPDLGAGTTEIEDRAHALHASLQRLYTQPDATRVLPAHASVPLPFDGVQWSATLGEIRGRVPLVGYDEARFVETLLSRIPDVPPTYHEMVLLNRSGAYPEEKAMELEAGANRCAA